MRQDTLSELKAWPTWIGKQVSKVSGKPFKSTKKVNTVTDITVHPITGVSAFTFAEDESLVECFRTVLISDKPSWDDAPSWAFGLAFKCYSEWCWIALNGVPGFICFEQRPLTHIESADPRVRELIMTVRQRVHEQREACRLAQIEHDRARSRAVKLVKKT